VHVRREVLTGTAAALVRAVAEVTPEEFHLRGLHGERDSRLGGDLLFLLTNNDRLRRTTELVDVKHARAVETDVVVDVDPSSIAHQGFRPDGDRVRLPAWTRLRSGSGSLRCASSAGARCTAGLACACRRGEVRPHRRWTSPRSRRAGGVETTTNPSCR
jgi:hypothetical protein